MKAREVLHRYAAGDRDFRGANLRGQSFKGQDLSGADFSEADIRGTNFTHARLKEANFTNAKAGVQRHWLMVQLMLTFVLSAMAGALLAYQAIVITSLFLRLNSGKAAYLTTDFLILVLIVVSFIAIIREGFTFRVLLVLALATGVDSAIAFAVNLSDFNHAFTIPRAIVIIGASIGVSTVVISLSIAVSGVKTVFFAIPSSILVASARASFDPTPGAIIIASIVTLSIASAVVLLSLYTARLAFRGNEKFALSWAIGVMLSSVGGTSFRGAHLMHANFSNSFLKSTNFNHTKQKQTILEWVNWQDAKKLDYARVGNSLLADSRVRDLLVTRNGYKKSYIDANFRIAILDGANLEQADLTSADFSCSSLRCANLKDANLTEARILNTDLTEANLTGACLEDWNIDSKTSLEQVDCQYVYLLRDQQERRPSSGDFAPGEFTKLFQEVLSTVDLIFRNGVDWKAFVTAFQQVQTENEDTPLDIQRIENKGDGVVVVRVNVPPETDKSKIHSEFNQQYELALKALEARYQAELQAKEGEIIRYREDSANMWEVIKLQASQKINVQMSAEAKAMNESNDSSRKIEIGNIGGNFVASGQALSIGDISGNVTNTINQLPDEIDPTQPNLKELLTQLQAAITAEPSLPETDKADLLEQVQNLATAKQTAEPAQKEGLVRKAQKIFAATLQGLPDTAKIAEACSKLLPLILKVLGLPG